jgi:hypothetical protein
MGDYYKMLVVDMLSADELANIMTRVTPLTRSLHAKGSPICGGGSR